MSDSEAPIAGAFPVPDEICGYTVDSALTAGESFLAIGPGGRGVVLKKMDPDCLLGGLLHPSIRERLCRIRELAHGAVANLHGVGREGAEAFLVWEYVDGRTFAEYLGAADRTPRDLLVVARELILAVDSLHMRGIVHGALGGGNVIVAPDGSIRLTHLSPLLYSDPSVDVDAVIALLEWAVEQRGEQDSPLARLLADARHDHMDLRTLGTKIAALHEPSAQPPQLAPQIEERHLRRRMLVGALIVALLGLALGYAVWRAVGGGWDARTPSRWVPNLLGR